MFQKKRWALLTEKTYNYQVIEHRENCSKFFYAKVENELGSYLVAPPFGDYIEIKKEPEKIFRNLVESTNNIPIKIKFISDSLPVIEEGSLKADGFIHKISFKSYEEWLECRVQKDFKRMISQARKRGVYVTKHVDFSSIDCFWRMHALLRLGKFLEIPQPRIFFENIYKEYFLKEKGFTYIARESNGNPIGSVVLLIDGKTAFYKFNASKFEFLKMRPNNLLIDQIVYDLDKLGIDMLDMGYTGSSDDYNGLRQFKKHAGALECARMVWKSTEFGTLKLEHLTDIKRRILTFVKSKPSFDQIDKFAESNYRLFI